MGQPAENICSVSFDERRHDRGEALISAFFDVLCNARDSHEFDFDRLLDGNDEQMVRRINAGELSFSISRSTNKLYACIHIESATDSGFPIDPPPMFDVEAAMENVIKDRLPPEDCDPEGLEKIAAKLDELSLKLKSAAEEFKGDQ